MKRKKTMIDQTVGIRKVNLLKNTSDRLINWDDQRGGSEKCSKQHVWLSVQTVAVDDQTYRVHLIQGLLQDQSINLYITIASATTNVHMLKTKCNKL